MSCKITVLAISDDAGIRSLVKNTLEAEGHQAFCASSSLVALDVLRSGSEWNSLLIDTVRNKPMDDLFAPELLQRFASHQICILSDLGETYWKSYANSWKINRVLVKPLLRHDLEKLITGWEFNEVVGDSSPSPHPKADQTIPLMEELDNQTFFLAASPAMVKMHSDIRILASVDHPVLILGESGVGKEVIAKLLHKHHARAGKPFINVNTAALPSELLESELFGYEAGAFTGAVKAKPGKFELADKGTLLLDEIGEMSPMMQAKLLHVLQDGSFSRLGSRYATQVNVRILAATNIDLGKAIEEKRFREDLYYRLSAFTITVPPLRERREEIPLLIAQMMKRGAEATGMEPVYCSNQLTEAAQEYHWPGNLRELRNFVTRLLVLRDQDAACAYLSSKNFPTFNERVPMDQTLDSSTRNPLGMKGVLSEVKSQTESRIIKEALSASGWNRRRAATDLNISYRALLYKIQQHGLRA
jgi:two-component system response regulator AtoC